MCSFALVSYCTYVQSIQLKSEARKTLRQTLCRLVVKMWLWKLTSAIKSWKSNLCPMINQCVWGWDVDGSFSYRGCNNGEIRWGGKRGGSPCNYVNISLLCPWANMLNFIIIDPNEIFWQFIISDHHTLCLTIVLEVLLHANIRLNTENDFKKNHNIHN